MSGSLMSGYQPRIRWIGFLVIRVPALRLMVASPAIETRMQTGTFFLASKLYFPFLTAFYQSKAMHTQE